MSLKLLNILLDFGKIWGLTLSLRDQNSKLATKIIITVCYILVSVWILAGMILRYQNVAPPMLRVSGVVLDVFMFNVYTYTIIVINFQKKAIWGKLINNLKLIDDVLEVKENARWCSFFLIALMNFFGLAVLSLSLFRGPKSFWISRFQICLQAIFITYCTYLLSTVAHIIFIRYKCLKAFIINLKKAHLNIRHCLQKAQSIAYILKVTVDLYNQLFGWLLLNIIAFGAVVVLRYINFFLVSQYSDTLNFLIFVIIGFFLFYVSM